MAAWPVGAADGDADEASRRERFAAERLAVQARYDAAVRECQRTFAVTACVNQAKAERRTALDRVSRETAELDDAARKRRAEERRQRITQKQQAAAARTAASAPEVQLREPRQTAPAASSARPARRVEPRSAEAAKAAEQRASQRQAQSVQRREHAQSHRQAAQQRMAQRKGNRAPAAPLPDPAASAAAR